MMEKQKKKKWWIVVVVVWLILAIGKGLGGSEENQEIAPQTVEIEKTEVVEHPAAEVAKPEFSMWSNDTVGAAKHTLVGSDNAEPSGTYRIVCTSGHGSLTINDADLYVLANDECLGTEYSGLTYEAELVVELSGSDALLARNFNTSDFKIEFYLVEE